MSEKKIDFAKTLAILAQPKEQLPPLEHVERRVLDVPFYGIAGDLQSRKMKIVIPDGGIKPMPLIWIPHYEMGEDSLELRDYLAEGWAVACPTESPEDTNGKASGDGVIFNNAALFMLRQMPEFDSDRIALVGGSAGGYMALMQMGTNLGLCAVIANGPVANMYFNFHHCWPMAQRLNQPVLLALLTEKQEDDQPKPENPALALMQKLSKLPIPFIAALGGSFEGNGKQFPANSDVGILEQTTGVGIAHRFSNPLMVNHNTSDILVPVDQITRRFTYITPGDSLPADFDLRLPADLPGKLKCSLEECLPGGRIRVERIIVPEGPQPDGTLPYDGKQMFNLNIFDDGPPEGYGSHSARMDVGRRLDVPYLKEMFEKTAAKTNELTAGMLRYMLDLYCGVSTAYPVLDGVDPDIYGSIQMYRRKVCMELSQWTKHHGKAALTKMVEEAIRTEISADEERLQAAINEILSVI